MEVRPHLPVPDAHAAVHAGGAKRHLAFPPLSTEIWLQGGGALQIPPLPSRSPLTAGGARSGGVCAQLGRITEDRAPKSALEASSSLSARDTGRVGGDVHPGSQ